MADFSLRGAGIVELMHDPHMVEALKGHARSVALDARNIAPVKTGEYLASIGTGTFDDVDRVTAYVSASAPYAIEVEAKHRVLGEALGVAEIIGGGP